MKIFRSILLIFCLLFVSSVSAKPKVYFNYKVYYTPDKSPYVSTILQFFGGSFKYRPTEDGDLLTSVEITQIFKKGDSIALADKYVLDSPLMKDSIVSDFFDIQNYGLDTGVYNYELIVKDLTTGLEVSGNQSIKVEEMESNEIAFSDILYIQEAHQTQEKNNFVKNGVFILPYLTNYFPPETDKIAFYLELYNTKKIVGNDQEFLITYNIKNHLEEKPLEDIFKFKRLQSSEVVPVIGYLPITKVPSGDFDLEINVINKENDTVATKIAYFQRRSNMEENYLTIDDVEIDEKWMNEVDRDSLDFYLGGIMPISPKFEYETIRRMLKSGDTTKMEKYFFAYWKKSNPQNPERAWKEYKRSLYAAEKLFSTQIKHGWETDRGRIWLKYGAPDQFIDRPNEPSAYPYQIWHYYRIGQRSNIRFVFYNPDLVTNDYPMLHSDMQGELQNYRWRADLHKRDTPNYNPDDPGGSVHYGGNANLYYNEIDR